MNHLSVPVDHQWDKAHWDWPLQNADGIVKIVDDAEQFSVTLDCPYFTPAEIKVNVRDGEVVVSCAHSERTDSHGRVERSVTRAYHLPSDVDQTSLKSYLSARGHLHLVAKKKQ